jgi:hypothetical protein
VSVVSEGLSPSYSLFLSIVFVPDGLILTTVGSVDFDDLGAGLTAGAGLAGIGAGLTGAATGFTGAACTGTGAGLTGAGAGAGLAGGGALGTASFGVTAANG